MRKRIVETVICLTCGAHRLQKNTKGFVSHPRSRHSRAARVRAFIVAVAVTLGVSGVLNGSIAIRCIGVAVVARTRRMVRRDGAIGPSQPNHGKQNNTLHFSGTSSPRFWKAEYPTWALLSRFGVRRQGGHSFQWSASEGMVSLVWCPN